MAENSRFKDVLEPYGLIQANFETFGIRPVLQDGHRPIDNQSFAMSLLNTYDSGQW